MVFQKIGEIITLFDPTSGKYVSREYQSYGLFLAEKLNDDKHKSLYIKLAKTVPRYLLEKAYGFVADSKAKNMGALFMWKLKELRKKKAEETKSKSTKLKQDETL
ncbi:MAG: hypothetical protein WC775_05195 [Patescibacteria group bacterium]|jgi:hypothetical protein